jgi:neutral trehalase
MPLLLDDLPAEHAAALAAVLADPFAFAAPCPIPSLALDEPAFSTDMWRGPAWINLDYLACQGLKKHGYAELAAEIMGRALAAVRKHYEASGVIYEYYDALDQTPPALCG